MWCQCNDWQEKGFPCHWLIAWTSNDLASIRRPGLNLDETEMKIQIDGLVQDCSNSSALAMELLQSCTKPSRCYIQENIFENVVLLFSERKHVTCCTRKSPLAAKYCSLIHIFPDFVSTLWVDLLSLPWAYSFAGFVLQVIYNTNGLKLQCGLCPILSVASKHHVNSFLTVLQEYSITIPLQQHLSNMSVIFNRCVLKKKCMKRRK